MNKSSGFLVFIFKKAIWLSLLAFNCNKKWIVTWKAGENFKQTRHNSQNDNNANKVHQKFPLDISVICLKFLTAIKCY